MAGQSLAAMIGGKISKMKPGGGSGSSGSMPMPGGGGGDDEEAGEFAGAARAVFDAIGAESFDAFETALKSAIKACVAEQKAKETAKPTPEADEGESDKGDGAGADSGSY